MSHVYLCGSCNSEIRGNQNAIECKGQCSKWFHTKCVSISTKELDGIVKELRKPQGKRWSCEVCRDVAGEQEEVFGEAENDVSDLDVQPSGQISKSILVKGELEMKEVIKILGDLCKQVERQNEEIQMLREELRGRNSKEESLQTNNPSGEGQKSYSRVLEQSSKHALVISPVDKNQENAKTRQEFKQIIKPVDLGVGITKIAETKNGGVVVKCKSKEESTKICNEVQGKMGDKYKVHMPELRRPRIKVVGIEDDMSADELKECLIKQNEELRGNSTLKVITMKRMKQRFKAIIESDGETFAKIITKGYLCVGYSVCAVYESIDVYRCYKCWGFNHKGINCTKKQRICMKCGLADHVANECTSPDKTCPNCTEANDKFKGTLDVDHSPLDSDRCQIYKRRIEMEKARIQYSI